MCCWGGWSWTLDGSWTEAPDLISAMTRAAGATAAAGLYQVAAALRITGFDANDLGGWHRHLKVKASYPLYNFQKCPNFACTSCRLAEWIVGQKPQQMLLLFLAFWMTVDISNGFFFPSQLFLANLQCFQKNNYQYPLFVEVQKSPHNQVSSNTEMWKWTEFLFDIWIRKRWLLTFHFTVPPQLFDNFTN